MAKERFFTGFEAGAAHDLNVVNSIPPSWITADGTARTGDFHFQVYHPGTAGVAIRCTKTLANTYTCATDQSRVIARMQVAVWLDPVLGWPSGANSQLFGFSIGTAVAPQQACEVRLQSTGLLSVFANSLAQVDSGLRLARGRWYVLRLEFTYQRNDAGNDPVSATVWVYDGDSMDSPLGPTLVGQFSATGSANIANFTLNGPPTLGTASTGASSRFFKYDDWWYSVADGADANTATNPDLAWPTASRVVPVLVTRQVSSGWTGGFDLVREIPNSGVNGNEQTQTGAGASTIFGHKTAAELGLIPPTDDAAAPDPPPFTGAGGLDGWSAQGAMIFGGDLANGGPKGSLPVPVNLVVTPTAGGGSFTGGVWVRVATLELTGTGSLQAYRTSAWSSPVYVSAAGNPNFSLAISADLAPSTPPDALVGTDGWVRYGVVALVTNAYTGSAPMDPATGATTNLSVSGGDGAVDASPYGSIVALQAFLIRGGVPYPATHPETRLVSYNFPVLLSPRQSASWAAFFAPPAAPGGTTHLPVCAAIKVYANIKRTAVTGTDNILINGTATSVPSAVTYPASDSLQVAYDWVEKTADDFDAFTFGAQTGSAIATQLGNILAEVMTAGPTVPKTLAATKYIQKVGIYVSNGSFQQVDVGFKPAVVFVKRIGATAAFGALKCWWMGGTMSWQLGSAGIQESISIMDLTDTGFIVGPAQNANGTAGGAATYAYVAVADGEQDVNNGAYLITNCYYRDAGVDPTTTYSVPFPGAFVPDWTPDVLWINGTTTVLKTPEVPAGQSLLVNSGAALVADAITAIANSAFTIGANVVVSSQGQYPYVALRSDIGGLLASAFETGSFAGTNGAQTIPTPFTPAFVLLHKPGGGYTGRFRSGLGNTGNNSVPWPGGAVTTTDITAIGVASFDVGVGASVTGQTSYWLIWKGDATFGDIGSTDLPPPDDSDANTPGTPGNPDGPTICSGGGLPLFAPTIGGHGCTKC